MPNDIPADRWYDYTLEVIDAVDVEDKRRAMEGYVAPPPSAPDDHIRRDYFRSSKYPYPERLGIKAYLEQKYRLQVELVKLQNSVKDTGQRVMVIMEGRDAAGKGSTIKRFMEFLNPRGASVVALEKPTEREQGQWYFQRYVDHLPGPGEIVFFDRSWYNRAGVERVMGFCTKAQYREFVRQAPLFEQMLSADGISIFKFYLSISKTEQARRFEERRDNPLKQWKLSPIDIEAQARWDAYTEAKEKNLSRTDTPQAPWTLVKADDKLRARLETMRTVLSRLEYAGKDPSVATAPDPWIVAQASTIFAAPPGSKTGPGPASA